MIGWPMRVALSGVGLALASAAWIDPTARATYDVFLVFAFAYSFLWLDSETPASVAHMATVTAFVYIAGFPILFFDLLARCAAYPLLFLGARFGLITLPRSLRPLVQPDRAAARRARIDLAATLGLATVGSTARVLVVLVAGAAGVESLIAMIALGEAVAYTLVGVLTARLSLPDGPYPAAALHRLPTEGERVDVVFATVLIVPLLVLLIAYGWLEHGLIGAWAWSLTSLAPHALVQNLVRRRHLLDERHAALERANATLARKQKEIEDFTYTVAHDLKAPLTAISMTSDALLDGTLDPPERRDMARILRIAGETENMIVDLLGMVRIVSEPEPVETVDLGAITTEALAMLEPHIADRGVVVDVAAPLPAIPGQATKLRHVVGNLVGNAIRFVPEGTGRIDIGATRDDGSVVLSVGDNGVGIPAEYHHAIFEMFRRVPNGDAEHAGSGMGLAIVKRIAEAHGGTVWVESAPGSGSVFRVRLPAR